MKTDYTKLFFLMKKIYFPLTFMVVGEATIFYFTFINQKYIAHFDFLGIKDTESFINLNLGSIIIFLILSTGFLGKYRRNRAKIYFNQGDVYLDMSKFYFWFAAKMIGYKKMTLVRVPLHLQFELILEPIFTCYITDEHENSSDEVNIKYLNKDKNNNKEINLALSDTYKVKLDELPKSKRDITTIFIENGEKFNGIRTYNINFVQAIKKHVHKLSKKYKKVNLFAHTNTQHNKKIIESSFKMGGRSGFEKVSIYKYLPDSQTFLDKPHKITL